MKVPNQEPCLHNGAIHTIEHLAATYLRNDEEWKDRIIYWGPMGCLTGNYLLIKGDLESKDIVELMKRTFQFIADFEGEIPGQAAKDCGNYLLHDLPMAKYEVEEISRRGTQLHQGRKLDLSYTGLTIYDRPQRTNCGRLYLINQKSFVTISQNPYLCR